MSEDSLIKSDWCVQIRDLAEKMSPCKYDELLFHAIQLVPHAVARNSFAVRKKRARAFIKSFCVIDGDTCIARPRQVQRSCMRNCVEEMKTRGISDPCDHMRLRSAMTYQAVLQKLGWIEVQPNRQWKWTGPPNADYRDAVKANNTRSTSKSQ